MQTLIYFIISQSHPHLFSLSLYLLQGVLGFGSGRVSKVAVAIRKADCISSYSNPS